MTQETVNHTIRLDSAEHAALAQRNERSLSGEVRYALKRHLAQHPPKAEGGTHP